ncbi:hypothetical protein F5Y13DRAFT_201679 [Hypoxylon sp. FL1857]|nr:hypothetical protein F5Y13DRAFT_201679 [Hypoxylon sp. FL1857]
MDHIPRPVNSMIPHLEVPFLDIIPYQLGHFDDFWRVTGFSHENSDPLISEATSGSPSRNQASDFIAGYGNPASGLARDRSVYVGEIVNPFDFLHVTPDNKRLVTSTRFMTNLERPEHDVQGLFVQARSFLAQISRIPYATQDPLPVLLLSISVLLSSLDETYRRYDVDYTLHYLEHDLPQTLLLMRPYFVSLLTRRERPGIDHSLCSEICCMANNVDEETYQTFHVSRGCRCPMVGVDETRLAEIVRQGSIPVIYVETDRKTKNPKLRLKAASPGNKYVALSHVWADGLGNPRSNSLPQCQIKRLARQISALPKCGTVSCEPPCDEYLWANWVPTNAEYSRQTSRLFWMDTLCVPVDDSDLRTHAINRMAAVYAGASHVLVLDYELQQLRLGTQPLTDHMAFIISCNWSSRSWTYQEGTLSRACYFQCADGAINPIIYPIIWRPGYFARLPLGNAPIFRVPSGPINMDHLPDIEFNFRSGMIQHGLRRSIIQLLCSYKPRRPGFEKLTNEYYYSALVDTWNMLIHRSTTKVDDLYSILCNLMDFKPYQLTELQSNSERMAAIFYSSTKIPLAFLYNRSPRYLESEDHLDRWLPTTVNGSCLSHSPPLIVKEDGFYTDSNDLQPIILLSTTKLEDICSLVTKEGLFVCNIQAHRCNGDKFRVDESIYIATGILLEKDIRAYHGQIRGACVHVTAIEDGGSGIPKIISVVYDCPITATQSFRSEMWTGNNSPTKVYIDRTVENYSLIIKRERLHFPHQLSRRVDLGTPYSTVVRMLPILIWFVPTIAAWVTLYPDPAIDPIIYAGVVIIELVPFFRFALDVTYFYVIATLPLTSFKLESLAVMLSKYVLLFIYTVCTLIWSQHIYNSWVAGFGEAPAPWYEKLQLRPRRWQTLYRRWHRSLRSQPNETEMPSVDCQV